MGETKFPCFEKEFCSQHRLHMLACIRSGGYSGRIYNGCTPFRASSIGPEGNFIATIRGLLRHMCTSKESQPDSFPTACSPHHRIAAISSCATNRMDKLIYVHVEELG